MSQEESFKFTPEETSKIIEWYVKQPHISKQCSTCGHSPLMFDASQLMAKLLDSEKWFVFSAFICSNCGYTRLHSSAEL